jgi:hypothetical protein
VLIRYRERSDRRTRGLRVLAVCHLVSCAVYVISVGVLAGSENGRTAGLVGGLIVAVLNVPVAALAVRVLRRTAAGFTRRVGRPTPVA